MMVMDNLLAVSVWADLRRGVDQLSLLTSIGARVGLESILFAEDGPLAPTSADAARLGEEFGSPLPVVRRSWRSGESPTSADHLPAWAGRDLFAAVAGRQYRSVDVAVSVGRTDAEAKARAAGDPLFQDLAGDLDDALVGRLEDVQEKVARLAAGGIRQLCCILPQGDLVDHLAQLSSIAVGTLETHYPGSPRSADPLPPAGWGGPAQS